MPDGFEPGELVEVTVTGRIVHARKWEWTKLTELAEGSEFMAPPHARLTRINPAPEGRPPVASMGGFEVGETVDIAIKNARVLATGVALVTVEVGDLKMHVPVAGAAITRTAPAEWPPLAGDLWRDQRSGQVWFAHLTEGLDHLTLRGPEDESAAIGDLLRWGPIFIHREQAHGGER